MDYSRTYLNTTETNHISAIGMARELRITTRSVFIGIVFLVAVFIYTHLNQNILSNAILPITIPVVTRITPIVKLITQSVNIRPNMTKKQEQILKKLAESDLAYQHDKTQKFYLKYMDSFKNDSEIVPIYADWNKVDRHVNETWYEMYQQAEGKYDASFKPPMTLKERQLMTATLEVFIKACKWANVTYFLCGGSMLGAYRHHGFIPWDDDMDVGVRSSDWRKLHYVLSRVPKFSVYPRGNERWKFFITDLPRTTKYPSMFRWPFVDIFFYTENSTHVWGTTTMLKDQVKTKKSDIYPLRMVPYEHMWAPIPCNAYKLMAKLYGNLEDCVTLWYNHKAEQSVKTERNKCQNLHLGLPFVFRVKSYNGTEVEILKVGNRTVHTHTYRPVC